jgi:hypothetical protein
MRMSHPSPPARNGQENLGRFLHERRLMIKRKRQVSVALRLGGQRSKSPPPPHERRATPRERPLPRPPNSAQSSENLLGSSRDSYALVSISPAWMDAGKYSNSDADGARLAGVVTEAVRLAGRVDLPYDR